jgi:hypothetical protein
MDFPELQKLFIEQLISIFEMNSADPAAGFVAATELVDAFISRNANFFPTPESQHVFRQHVMTEASNHFKATRSTRSTGSQVATNQPRFDAVGTNPHTGSPVGHGSLTNTPNTMNPRPNSQTAQALQQPPSVHHAEFFPQPNVHQINSGWKFSGVFQNETPFSDLF